MPDAQLLGCPYGGSRIYVGLDANGNGTLDDCVDLDKPPVIVIDPRAGHGPGIGGFKHDSEVGMAALRGEGVESPPIPKQLNR